MALTTSTMSNKSGSRVLHEYQTVSSKKLGNSCDACGKSFSRIKLTTLPIFTNKSPTNSITFKGIILKPNESMALDSDCATDLRDDFVESVGGRKNIILSIGFGNLSKELKLYRGSDTKEKKIDSK